MKKELISKLTALVLVTSVGISTLSPAIIVKATTEDAYEEIYEDINLGIEELENGNIRGVLNENGINSIIEYNPFLGETYLNGELLPTDISIDNSENNMYNSRYNYSWVYLGTVNHSIPIGTTVSTAISLVSIWTGIPLSKVKQTILVGGGLAISQKLDNIITLKKMQYRTSKMVTEPQMTRPQYKYRDKVWYYYKGKQLDGIVYDFFGSKPYSLESSIDEIK